MACFYTYKGQTYGEQEFKILLAQQYDNENVNGFIQKIKAKEIVQPENGAGMELGTESPEVVGTPNENEGGITGTSEGNLTPEEKANLQSIEIAAGDNFRLIQNVYNKYGEGKSLAEITVEDYEKAKEKRDRSKEPPKEKRRFTQHPLQDPAIPEDVKAAFSEETIYYNRLPNKISSETATKILEYLGPDNARKEILDFNNGMGSAVRFIMAQNLLKMYRDNGEYDVYNDLLEEFVKVFTDYGQGIQALSLYDEGSPETNIAKAKKEIDKQREQKFKEHKPITKRIIKEAKEINKESAKEAVKKVKAKIDKSSEIQSSKPISEDYGTKNKIVTKARYNQLKKQIRGKFFSSVIPPELVEIGVYHLEAGSRKFGEFAANMVYEFGSKIKPYLKKIYNKSKESLGGEGYSTEEEINTYENEQAGIEAKKRIERLFRSGKKTDHVKAIAEMNNLPNKKAVWGQYKKEAASRLKNLLMTEISDDINKIPILQEFTNGLVKNIRQQIEQKKGVQQQRREEKPAIQIIADAYKNIEKYQEAWDETKKQVLEKFKGDESKLEQLDEYFGDIFPEPFSEKLVESAVKKGLKDLNIKIADIVVQHYTVYDRTLDKLSDKLVKEAGLEGKEAEELADAISDEFDRIATQKKRDMLNRIFSEKQRNKPKIKSLEQEIVELTNLGAFEDDAILKKYAKAFEFPELTRENIKKIEELSHKVSQAKEGFQKSRAIEDLLAYQANIKGLSKWEIGLSLWYSSMLSGPFTQLRNLVSNTYNTMFLFLTTVRKPKSSYFVAKGLFNGIYHGLFEAYDTWRTGYSPIRGKVEVPPVLERVKFYGKYNPANVAKYVRRAMVAADVLFFEGLREMRAYQLAYNEALKKNTGEPGFNAVQEAYKILNNSDDVVAIAQETAEIEYKEKLSEINESDASSEEKENAKKQAKRDMRRRVYELVEQGRDVDFSKEAASFASKGTYNYMPEGILGAIAKGLNNMANQQGMGWLRLAIPFTNIIANVANETINYTPLGAIAAWREGGVFKPTKEEMTEQERKDQMTKAFIGTSFMVALYILSQSTGDDDEPVVEVTANGTGDFRKNYELKETGWQPYSIKIGDKWYSYQYTPLMLGLSFIGNIRDAEKYRKEKLNDEFWTKTAVAATGVTRSFFDQTFLASANAGLSAISDPRNEDAVSDLTEWAKRSLVTTVVPNIYSQTAREIENWYNIPTKEIRGTYLGALLKDIPVARDKYFNKVNALGEDIVPDVDIFVSPQTDDKIWNLIAEKKAFIGVPSIKTVSVIDPQTKEERPLTHEEYYKFCKIRGESIKSFISKNYDALNKMDSDGVKSAIDRVKRDATMLAKMKILYPEYFNSKPE